GPREGAPVARVVGAQEIGVDAEAAAAIEGEALPPEDLREPVLGRGLDERDFDRPEVAPDRAPALLLAAGEADDDGAGADGHARAVEEFLQAEGARAHVRGLLQLERDLAGDPFAQAVAEQNEV